jgi:histidine triad (HIT) family protein
MDCTFCDIVARRLPAEILWENDRVIAILDMRPIHFGHALVMPKTHCTDFLSLPDGDLYDVLRTSQIISRALVGELRAEGFNLFSNNGSCAGQTVFHFHIHITPRYADDNIRFVLTLKRYQRGAMSDYGERIRREIAASAQKTIPSLHISS